MTQAVETEPRQEILRDEVKALVNQCPPEIVTDQEFQESQEWLVTFTAKRQEVEAFFEKLKKPLKQSIKDTKANIKELDDQEEDIKGPLSTEETRLRKLVAQYQQKKLMEQQQAQAKLNQQFEKKVERAMCQAPNGCTTS